MKNNQKINLENIPKSSGFKVPNGYFENLSSRVQEKIIQEEKVKKPVKGAAIISLQRIAIAASVVGFAFVAWLLVKNLRTPQMKTHYTELEINEVINSDLFFYDVENIILTDDFSKELDKLDSPEESTLSKDAIVDYLMDENIDIDFLLDETSMNNHVKQIR